MRTLSISLTICTVFLCALGASPFAACQPNPNQPVLAPPDPCARPAPIQQQELAKFANRWIEIQPIGCLFADLPPSGVRVLLFYPGCNHSLCKLETMGVLLSSGFRPDSPIAGHPTFWMYPLVPPGGSGFHGYRVLR